MDDMIEIDYQEWLDYTQWVDTVCKENKIKYKKTHPKILLFNFLYDED